MSYCFKWIIGLAWLVLTSGYEVWPSEWASKSYSVETGSPSYERLVTLKHVSPESISGPIQMTYPTVRVANLGVGRRMILKGPKKAVIYAKNLIKKLDQPFDVVALEVTVVELNGTQQQEFRHLFSGLNQQFLVNVDPNTQKIMSPSKISSVLQQLEAKGDAKIIAEPHLLALSGSRAEIQVGDRVPFQKLSVEQDSVLQTIDYLDIGLYLSIIPKVINDNLIEVEVRARINSVKQFRTVGHAQVPVLSTREANTIVRLPPNAPIIIAGLTHDSILKTKSGVPILQDIPLIGWLFTDTANDQQKTDIIFKITPRILGG